MFHTLSHLLSRSKPTTRRRSPFAEFLDRLEDRITPAFGETGLLSPIAAPGCDPIAAVAAGPRLASVDTAQSALLNGLLTNLTGAGSGLSLTAVDYEGLSNADLNLGSLLGQLQAQLGVGTPQEALTANATLGQILAAAAAAAQADGDTATATIFNNAITILGPLTGTISLGDLLQVDLPTGSLAQAEVNALDLLTGAVQLFNFENVLTTTAPITISGAALGLPGILNEISLQAQVVEPPVIVVGEAGTTFFSAAIRAKLNLDLVDLSLDGSGLLAPIQALLGPLADLVTVNASVGQLQVFADVARGSGVIQSIDAITNAVTLQATPSIADLYVGQIADALFFNRTRAIDPATDLTAGVVGGLTINASLLGVTLPGFPINVGLTLRAFAEGDAATPTIVNFLPPYPQVQTIGSSAIVIGNLITDLIANLELGVSGNLGLLAPLLGTITNTLTGALTPVLQPILAPLLGDVVDPLLDTLGIGIGEMDLAVLGADSPDPAVAANDGIITLQNQPVTANVLANDLIPTNCPRTLTISSGPTNGTVVVNADNTITYTPNTGFLGADVFAYTLTDQFGRTTTALVTVMVGLAPDPNLSPTINPDVVATPVNTPVTIAVLANDSDPDGDALAVIGVSAPANGTLAMNPDGTITYTPIAGFQGIDSFVYAASDGKGGIGSATVTITVGTPPPPPPPPPGPPPPPPGSNNSPTVNPDTTSTPQGTPVAIPVLANDTDPDGDPLSVIAFSQPSHGTVVLNADGSVTYTPTAGFVGLDRFTYTASDSRGGIGGATVTVNVGTGGTGNVAPTVNGDAADTPVNTPVFIPVLLNDSDPNGDILTVASVTQPANGTVIIGANGVLVYTPKAGFIGTDVFTYTASDGAGGTGSASVTVKVGSGSGDGGDGPGGNNSPEINGDGAATQPDQPVTIPVLANDSDPDGDPLTIVGVTQPANGTVTINADGTITYTPNAGFIGTESFAYSATDGRGGTGAAGVQVTVGQGGRGPVLSELKQYAVSADTLGGPRVTVYNPDGSVRFDFFAYDPSGRFGANVVMGDLNGDGVADIVTAPGFGGGPHIRVLDGQTLAPIVEFFAFESSFRGGCTLAIGDVNGDGVNDLVVAAGKGGGPRVRVLDGTKLNLIGAGGEIQAGALLDDFYAFDSSFGGGVSVAVSDRDGDGVGEVVTGSGPGGPPLVRLWDIPSHKQLTEFLAFDMSFSAGVNVGARGEFLAFGAGQGAAPVVRIFRGETLESELLAYEETFQGGVRVAFGDTVDPSKPLLLVGAGPTGGPRIKVLRPNLEVVLPDYFAFEETFRGGVFVA